MHTGNAFRSPALAAGLLSLPVYVWIGYFALRTQFTGILIAFALLFAGYAVILRDNKTSLHVLIVFAILTRALLIASFPNLSDDVYRFLWDGNLQLHGVNPFAFTPMELMSREAVSGVWTSLFEHLNSASYFSVYPPVDQMIFLFSVACSGGDPAIAAMVMKCIILLAETGSILLMMRLLNAWNMKVRNVLIYAFNPLVIVELSGNIHFEACMVFFLLLAIYWLQGKRYMLSAAAFAFSVGVKLLPLMFLPLMMKRTGWKQSMRYVLMCGLVLLVQFIPYAGNNLWNALRSSIGLYFHTFEFNASIYYILRWIGYQTLGYDIIAAAGTALALLAFMIILYLAAADSKDMKTIFSSITLSASIYFFCSTIVHPWYVTPLVAYAVLGRWRYPLLWSCLIPLSYFTYSALPYHENLWLTAAAYLPVFGMAAWEWRRHSAVQKMQGMQQ